MKSESIQTWRATAYHVSGMRPVNEIVQSDEDNVVPVGNPFGWHIPPHSSIDWRIGYDEVDLIVPRGSIVVTPALQPSFSLHFGA